MLLYNLRIDVQNNFGFWTSSPSPLVASGCANPKYVTDDDDDAVADAEIGTSSYALLIRTSGHGVTLLPSRCSCSHNVTVCIDTDILISVEAPIVLRHHMSRWVGIRRNVAA